MITTKQDERIELEETLKAIELEISEARATMMRLLRARDKYSRALNRLTK